MPTALLSLAMACRHPHPNGSLIRPERALAIREASGMRLFSDRMRTERLQVRNFIDGQFVERIPSLSFRAKSRNLWIFLRASLV